MKRNSDFSNRLLLIPHAVKLVARPDKKFSVGDRNRGTDHVVTLIPHRYLLKQFELIRGGHHKDLTMPILEIDFVIRGSRRGLNCDAAIQLSNPIGFSRRGLDPRDGLALAIE